MRNFIVGCFTALTILTISLFYKGCGYKLFNHPVVGSVWYHQCISGYCLDFQDSVLAINGDDITVLEVMRFDETSFTQVMKQENITWFNGEYLKRLK